MNRERAIEGIYPILITGSIDESTFDIHLSEQLAFNLEIKFVQVFNATSLGPAFNHTEDETDLESIFIPKADRDF